MNSYTIQEVRLTRMDWARIMVALMLIRGNHCVDVAKRIAEQVSLPLPDDAGEAIAILGRESSNPDPH